MGMSKKKLKQKRKETAKEKKKTDVRKREVDEQVLSSISDPNPWTPEREEAWLNQPPDALRDRFPPMTKPTHIKYRHTGPGWGEQS